MEPKWEIEERGMEEGLLRSEAWRKRERSSSSSGTDMGMSWGGRTRGAKRKRRGRESSSRTEIANGDESDEKNIMRSKLQKWRSRLHWAWQNWEGVG